MKEFPGFDVANYNNLELSKKIFSVHDIEKLIVTLRGVPVLIDRDLAFLYQVEVKQMNRQVKRNIERFPEDFMFQLTKKEYDDLKCQNGTSNDRGGDRRALPYAFTQQGIGMLSGLLRSQVAVETNIKIMRAFVGMQRYIAASMQIFQRLNIIELQQLETKHWMSVTNNKIEDILGKIEEISPKPLPEQLFPTGCVWDAWAYVSDLVRSAKNRIILIDNFVDDRVLSMLTKRSDGVSAAIHTRYSEQFLTDLKKHNDQYPKIQFIQLSHRNHDRFLIIDDKVFFMGASLKDMGTGLCAVSEISITPEIILGLLE
ncbi:MAG: ORF6N domain-containing protein [Bacteroidales bacterium]|nr:ORF6N domain-containing protein [Bacteroidales bacterium]